MVFGFELELAAQGLTLIIVPLARYGPNRWWPCGSCCIGQSVCHLLRRADKCRIIRGERVYGQNGCGYVGFGSVWYGLLVKMVKKRYVWSAPRGSGEIVKSGMCGIARDPIR